MHDIVVVGANLIFVMFDFFANFFYFATHQSKILMWVLCAQYDEWYQTSEYCRS